MALEPKGDFRIEECHPARTEGSTGEMAGLACTFYRVRRCVDWPSVGSVFKLVTRQRHKYGGCHRGDADEGDQEPIEKRSLATECKHDGADDYNGNRKDKRWPADENEQRQGYGVHAGLSRVAAFHSRTTCRNAQIVKACVDSCRERTRRTVAPSSHPSGHARAAVASAPP